MTANINTIAVTVTNIPDSAAERAETRGETIKWLTKLENALIDWPKMASI